MRQGFRDALKATTRTVELPLEPENFASALDRLWSGVKGRAGLIFARAGQAVGSLGHFAIRRGLRVPAEFALISLADDPFLRHIQPTIARYRRDEVGLARLLSALVIRAATGNALPPKMSLVMPEFERGETMP